MTSVNDVRPNDLIDRVAESLKQSENVKAPTWSAFVKTGAHAERRPDQKDWWYVRAASLLRKVGKQGPIGVGKLRNWYGGKKNRGVRPERHVVAGGKIIRLCLQQLEKEGLIQKKEKEGRVVTKKGQQILDKTATELAKAKE